MNADSLKEHVQTIFQTSGEKALDEFIESLTNPFDLIALSSELVLFFYWKHHDLRLTLKYGQRGIRRFEEVPAPLEGEPQEAYLKSAYTAKGIHYNLASFTWPGWAEPGVTIAPEQLSDGFHAAEKNLEMAIELQRGALATGRAHWMLAGHYLARQEFDHALQHYDTALDFLTSAEKQDEALMSQGFLELTRFLKGEEEALKAMHGIIERLAAFEDGPGFVSQIRTAQRVFQET